MSYAIQSYNLDDVLFDGAKVASNIGIVRNMDEDVIQLTCTIHNGHKTETYMEVFKELINKYVSSLEKSYDYQQGYLVGIAQGKKMVLEELKDAISNKECDGNDTWS